MASSKAEPDRSRSSDPGRKIRIVGKIRGFTDHESESLKESADAPWISVRKASEGRVAISFGDQSTKDVYEVDNCYEQNQDNLLIFERELKPFIPKVVGGQNVTVIAYGARGSGKTYTIQGTEENKGLASLAISEVISCVEGNGNSIAVSFYEVFQDHVYDLLDPTRPEVQVLEDAQGRIKLKGLSQGFVKSASEFQKLYPNDCASLRDSKKNTLQLARRSHKGLIIRVLSNNESSSANLLGKINFVDLAGYEDAKRMSSEGMNATEKNRVNMSLHALLNVVYALNANETHVPYRGSKLARMLRDSLGRKSHAVMFTCLSPLFCQDTIYATSLASRACQCVNRAATASNKKSNSSTKQMAPTPVVKGRLGTVCESMKKSTTSRATPIKKTPFLVKGRKLFDEEKHPSSSKQVQSKSRMAPVTQSMSLPDSGSAILHSPQDEVCVTQSMSLPDSGSVILPSPEDEEKSTSNTSSTQVLKEEVESTVDVRPTTVTDNEGDSSHCASNFTEVSSLRDSNKRDPTCLEDGNTLQKENIDLPMKDSEEKCTSQDMGKENCLVENGGGSPPLSERLRDLSNYLKSLHPPTPPSLNIQHETNHSVEVVSTDIEEPKTPVLQKEHGLVDKWELENINTPSETVGACGTGGFKQSFVQEYLKVLNTADKIKLKSIPGIGEKRANYILELREESPEPFKDLDDLKDIGLSSKQIKGMLKNVAAELFS